MRKEWVEIAFDRPDGRYHPGEELSGSVTITNPEVCQCKVLRVTIEGFSQVQWTERSRRRFRQINYSNGQYTPHFRQVISLMDTESELPAGVHRFKFAHVLLPDRLPNSMSHDWGRIIYAVALEGYPGIEKHFEVASVVDLNRESSLLLAVQCEEMRSFCFCGAFVPSKVYVAITIPQGGYIPAEKILVHCQLNNLSSKTFARAVFVLQQIITFTATRPRFKRRDAKMKVAEDVKRLPADTANNLTEIIGALTVPLSAAPTCNLSDSIKTSYLVKVVLQLAGYKRRQIVMRIPIKIGTVAIGPHCNLGTIMVDVPLGIREPNQCDTGTTSNDDPPSYTEAMRTSKYD